MAYCKYHATGKATSGYRSGGEKRFADDLGKRGVGFRYEELRLPYESYAARTYIPDFVLDNGIIIEYKGYFPAADRTKMLLVKAQYPNHDIRIIFESPRNKLSAKSKTTYAAWAEKHGFPWAHKVLPDAWLYSEGKEG
jgi:hypothetical protein